MSDHDTYAEWDAAYVLGALSAQDRLGFEAHLASCDACRAAVAELAAMPALLGHARPWFEDSPDPAGPPSNLVSLVEARDASLRKTARRRGWLIAAAAAAVLALGIGIPAALAGGGAAPATVVALEAVAATPLTATVSLDSAEWGTAISMTCDYPAGGAYPGTGGDYALFVTDAAGNSEQVASWAASPGATVELQGSTAVPLGQIATVEIRSAAGDVLLSAPVTT